MVSKQRVYHRSTIRICSQHVAPHIKLFIIYIHKNNGTYFYYFHIIFVRCFVTNVINISGTFCKLVSVVM
jgi:hypothetical protein